MKVSIALLWILSLGSAGDRIEELKWLPAKEAFEKAGAEKTPRWVLIYKEWPN